MPNIAINHDHNQPMPTFTSDVKAQLMAHIDSTQIPRAQLRALPQPQATATFKPVHHADLVDALEERLDQHGMSIRKAEFAVSHDAAKLFATYRLAFQENDEYGAALGLRTANNRTMSIQIAVGANVFVCDNMSFKGDMIALRRKHTSRLNIERELDGAINRYSENIGRLYSGIEKLRQIPLRTRDAEHMIFSCFDRELLPVRLFHPVIESYRMLKKEGVVSQWQLHNCFTLQAHKLPPQRRFKATTDIGKLFNL